MNIQDQFNKVSEQYDSQRKILIPCFNDFYDVAVGNLNLESLHPLILDLGAGTGIFSWKVIEKYPEAQMTLIDLSEKMLEIARKRFASIQNIKMIQADFSLFDMENKYDAIISSLAIHHLEDKAKQALYKNIYKGLKPGGVFINADQIAGENSFIQNIYHSQWCNKIEHSVLTREELDVTYERIKLDRRTSVVTQLNWLKEIGFQYVDCLYKYYDFAVMWAKKI